jgi:hypothetical protein
MEECCSADDFPDFARFATIELVAAPPLWELKLVRQVLSSGISLARVCYLDITCFHWLRLGLGLGLEVLFRLRFHLRINLQFRWLPFLHRCVKGFIQQSHCFVGS